MYVSSSTTDGICSRGCRASGNSSTYNVYVQPLGYHQACSYVTWLQHACVAVQHDVLSKGLETCDNKVVKSAMTSNMPLARYQAEPY